MHSRIEQLSSSAICNKNLDEMSYHPATRRLVGLLR